jgi:hypothetical protein
MTILGGTSTKLEAKTSYFIGGLGFLILFAGLLVA